MESVEAVNVLSSECRQQRTLARPAVLEGHGYWSGQRVRVEFHPAAAGTGIVFRRIDLPGAPWVPARYDWRLEVPRRTTLQRGSAMVEMVEHVLAALHGLQIDNCEVRVNARELPGNDGSCQDAVAALLRAGAVEQEGFRRCVTVSDPVRVADSGQWIEFHPHERPELVVAYELDYGDGNPVGRQSLEVVIDTPTFCSQIAPARTFLLESEALKLQAQGIGGHATYTDLLVFGGDGPIGNTLRFPDECARHKILDLVGDLALAGCDLYGRVIAHRTGHRLNAQLVTTIMAHQNMDILHLKTA